MVLRDVQRRPFRLLLSSASIALATAIVIAGGVFADSINEVLRLQFEVSHREDVTVTLDQARPWRAVREIAHLPGVVNAEAERVVPVRLRAGQRFHTTVIVGLRPHMDLHRLLDVEQRPLVLPPSGLSLSRVLAESLGVRVGEEIEVEVLESDRRKLPARVAVLLDDLIGISAYMDAEELGRLLDETPRANVVLASVEEHDVDEVTGRLNALPPSQQ